MDLIPKEETNLKSKKMIIVGVAILILLLIGAVLYFVLRNPEENESPINGTPNATSTVTTTTVDKFAPQEVGADTNVPEQGEQGGNGIAVPTVVTSAAPGSESKLRLFDLVVSGGKFIPETVTVRVGDTANIFITAQDRDYDFSMPYYGLFSTLPRGQKKTILFQATTDGKYQFFCKSCGGPESGPTGYVVVVPSQ